MPDRRKREQIQAELDQLNRDISWTFGRAGREGTDPDRSLYKTFSEKLQKLEKELKDCDA